MTPAFSVGVVLLGASLVASISVAQVAAALLLLLWIGRSLGRRSREAWVGSPLDRPILSYYAWGVFASLLAGASPTAKMFTSQNGVLLFFLLAHAASAEEIKSAARWFCLASVVVGLLGILQAVGGINYSPDERTTGVPRIFSGWPEGPTHFFAERNFRAVGTRSHPLTYAEGFIPAFLLVFVDVTSRRRFWVPGVAALVLMGGGILFAEGRGVWLGLALGIAVAVAMNIREGFRARILVAMTLAGALLLTAVPHFRHRVLSVFSGDSGSLSDQQSRQVRFLLWKAAVEKIKASPVVGKGFGGVRLNVPDPLTGRDRHWSEAHNIFLQTAAEQGLIGLSLFFWILIVLFRVIRDLDPPWRAAAAATLVAYLVAGLTESWTNDKEIAMIFWSFAGVVEGRRLKFRREREATA